MASFMAEEAYRRSREQALLCEQAAAAMDIVPTFSHITALRYQGIEVPESCTLRTDRLHISFDSRGARRRFKGVSEHYWSGSFEVTIDGGGGFYVTNPAMTWSQLSAYVSVESLAVIAGSLACRDPKRKLTTLDDLERYVEENRGFAGRRRCLDIMPYLMENSDSPPESVLVVLVMRGGLGRPEANFRIDLPSGGFRFADIAYPELKLAIEYQGAYHASPAQMREDARRWNQLRVLGWEIVFVTADDLRTDASRRAIVKVIRTMMERQLAFRRLAGVL
ncbi:hypothetical protein [Bifidobacterium callimiconis]|nr:hypothetical protein [Bifidobacterium callimiconis]MBT1176660.1 hypothetical protein [Bifidobacterium callimiconis]